MKLHKRIVAGISAFVMFMSVPLNSGFVAVAEETVPTVTEIQTDDDNGKIDESLESTTTTTTSIITMTTTTTSTTTGVETTTTETTTTKDISPPALNINISESEGWINYSDLEKWELSTSEGAIIYYNTYDINTEPENIMPSFGNAKMWSEGIDNILEGSHKIVFWAKYKDDDEREINISKPYSYHLDKSDPSNFEIKMETKKDGVTIISSENIISDNMSGISRVYYTINNGTAHTIEGIVPDAYGNINGFSFNISDDIENATIIVYAEDGANNKSKQIIENLTNDAIKPQISKIEIADTNKSPQEINVYRSFINEKDLMKEIFVNENYYLSVTIREKNLKEIRVYLNDGKPITLTSDEWICKETADSEVKTYYINFKYLKDLMTNNETYSIKIQASDNQWISDKNSLTIAGDECVIRYDSDPDPDDSKEQDNIDCTINFSPNIAQIEEGDGEESVKSDETSESTTIEGNYYRKFSDADTLNIIMEDDVGISGYEISVDGTRVTSVSCKETATETITTIVTDNNSDDTSADTTETVTTTIEYDVKVTSTEYSLPLSGFTENRKYSVEVKLVDLAGNSNVETYDFNVDTLPPEINDFSYTTKSSLLNFLTFGVFGKEDLTIDIDVQDNESGVGVNPDNVILHWAPIIDGDLAEYPAKYIDADEVYRFSNLPINNEAVPYIVVSDKLGNSNTYYFTIQKETESSDVVEFMLDKNEVNSVTLALEGKPPAVTVEVLESYQEYIVGSEIWYGSEIEYSVKASDADSGLNSIDVKNDDKVFKTETSFNDITFSKERFNDDAIYIYKLVDANSYSISATALDNAGNDKSDELKIHIDKENPVITKFVFGEQEELGSEIAKTTYGYYFKEETNVRIYANDPGVASGINSVTLTLSNIDGTVAEKTIYSTDVQAYITDETGEYAVFTIPMGFKGAVVAEVVDNVEHRSGLVNADGSIIEDETIHSSTSSINIAEDVNITKVDNDNTLLLNQSIPLTISVKDTFSGISTIEWSIANDGESGIITVSNDGNYDSDSSAATIGEVETESNLVTSMQFTLLVDDNSNGNVVLIKLTDRSGNTSELSKAYSIDTTAPTISASLSNQTPHNTMYYNTDQTVTISITERNFNASDVHFMLNGSEQIIGNWSTSGNGDSAVHTGRFTINTDGDYSYSISYSDMAGNMAEVFTQSMFVVDKTSPVIKTNFDEFKTEQEKHYFGLDSINKTAKITITEHNFSAKDANVEIFRLEPGSKHDISGIESTTASGWSDNGDEHTLEIPFEDGDDGVYLIRVTPVDLASNSGSSQETVVFEIDFTNPIISERNGIYAKDEEKSYEHLEVYNEITGVEEGFIPSVSFSDTNFDHIEYALTIYTPEYKNGKEIGDIIPDSDSGSITETIYSLPEFEKDGVYSVDLVAVDVAGNRSTLCRNTSVLMMKSDVLAYISNSSKAESTGWYSLQKDENTPISKRPDSFTDLYITVFAQEASDTRIILRNANGESQDTGITAENSEDMYAVGVYNYILPKEYFADNYPEGTNEDLYLWAENSLNGEPSHISLGWIRLDALAPSCNLPSDLKDWKSYVSTTKKITLTNISESLDVSKCVVYDNGKEISLDNFEYSEENNTLSYTLEKGWHDLSFVLVDEAGNINTIQEISSIQVGLLYCLWFRILCGVIAVAAIAAIIIIIRKKKSVSK